MRWWVVVADGLGICLGDLEVGSNTVAVDSIVSGWFVAARPAEPGGLAPLTSNPPARHPHRDRRDGIPTTGVEAVVLNVTVTGPTAPGFLTVWPDGKPQPVTSNLNFAAGQTIPNLVIAPVGPDGKIDLYNESTTGSVHIIADVSGWFATGTVP